MSTTAQSHLWTAPNGKPSSSMTLAGLMKHLAYVEDDWFGRWLHDEPRREPWASSVARARTAAEKAFTVCGLGGKTRRSWPDGRSPSPRWVLTHMIEEYARHNGHADLLRESVDSQVGE